MELIISHFLVLSSANICATIQRTDGFSYNNGISLKIATADAKAFHLGWHSSVWNTKLIDNLANYGWSQTLFFSAKKEVFGMLSFWENTKQKYLPFKYLAPHFLTDPVWTTAALHTLFPLSEKIKNKHKLARVWQYFALPLTLSLILWGQLLLTGR